MKNVVLVHGAFADGSGWKAVADILQHDGYTVYVVQEPETTFEADVAATRIVLDRSGPCVLVGHSYGGMIISEVGPTPRFAAWSTSQPLNRRSASRPAGCRARRRRQAIASSRPAGVSYR